MQVELCNLCGDPVRMMCQRGTGYCSINCQDGDELRRLVIPPRELPNMMLQVLSETILQRLSRHIGLTNA